MSEPVASTNKPPASISRKTRALLLIIVWTLALLAAAGVSGHALVPFFPLGLIFLRDSDATITGGVLLFGLVAWCLYALVTISLLRIRERKVFLIALTALAVVLALNVQGCYLNALVPFRGL